MKIIHKLFLLGIFFTVLSCRKRDASSHKPPDPPSTATQQQYIGVTFGYNKLTRAGGLPSASGNTVYNVPLFKSTANEDDWWDDMVEELAYSGVDFVAPVDRGHLPAFPDIDAGDPNRLTGLVAAMKRRSVENKFKIALFDDCPASWTANRNIDHGEGYDYSPLFDCGDTSNYKYIWDYNIKVAFSHVPDQMRFKIDDRPVIFFWGVSGYAFKNYGNGHLKAIILYIRRHCQAAFDFNPYIIVDHTWLTSDPATNDTTVVDAVDSWFTMTNPWTRKAYNGIELGCTVPGFYVVHGTTNMQIDANHGKTFIEGLKNTYHAGALLTLVEGFTDCAENAAVWRSSDTTYYDYPNQRLNIIRRYSHDPYPDTLKVEAEGCDLYHDLTPGNSGGLYRKGDLDITGTTDVKGGWELTNTQANEWLEWKELPLQGHTVFKLRYSANTEASVKLSVDGTVLSVAHLPVTGQGIWSTLPIGTSALGDRGLHNIRLTIVSGSPDINYLQLIAGK